uniref:Uncharacterized protein n=1 Tax=Globodera rostochiensis TaxID=31243 RepID=A0A914GQ06_GLORO
MHHLIMMLTKMLTDGVASLEDKIPLTLPQLQEVQMHQIMMFVTAISDNGTVPMKDKMTMRRDLLVERKAKQLTKRSQNAGRIMMFVTEISDNGKVPMKDKMTMRRDLLDKKKAKQLTKRNRNAGGKTAVWVHNKTAKPDIKKVIALAQATASYVGTAASLGGEVAMSAGKHLWPPVRRSTKKYILPTVAVLGRHTVPITMALAKSAYSNANALRPHVGRVVKPAWRVARDRAVKPSWRLSRELVMKPLYNRAVLPTMKRGAQKVLQWNEWEPELEQQQQGQQQQQQNVDAFSSAAEEEEEGHKNSGRKATTNEPNIFDKLGDDKWARRRKD